MLSIYGDSRGLLRQPTVTSTHGLGSRLLDTKKQSRKPDVDE